MEKHPDDPALSRLGDSSEIPPIHFPRKPGSGVWAMLQETNTRHSPSDLSLFSSSLPVLPHEKLNFTDLSNANKDPLEDVELAGIENTLPDDENELLAGLADDLDLSGLPSQLEEMEDLGFFGGMDMDFETQESLGISISNMSLSDGISLNGVSSYALANGGGTVAGEHPYGEHPSRTLFVRNINSNVEDSELKLLFEQFGDIRTLYTACKHRGFVMISYYDIRAARTAMRALQNKPLRRRKLDIHFSIPKDNPSEKDVNQGTLVVFNLDASVSNEDLRIIFGAYGEVKEIRETPHKRHHKFIEFYDVRAAESALRALNRSDIAGKRIKLEPSRPGGARRNLMQQLSQELEQDEARSFRPQVGSPVANSPPGNWNFGSPVEHNLMTAFSKSPGLGSFSPVNNGNHLTGLASILPPLLSSSPKMAPIGKDQGRSNQGNQLYSNSPGSTQAPGFTHSNSYTDQNMSTSPSPNPFLEPGSKQSNSVGTLSGPQFLWGSPTPYSERPNSSAWPTPSSGHSLSSSGQGQGHAFPYPRQHGSLIGPAQHHVGSAPSGIPLERHFGFFPESPETSYMNQVVSGVGLSRSNGIPMMNIGGRSALGAGVGLPGNIVENGVPSFRMLPLPKSGSVFLGNGSFSGSQVMTGFDGDRTRSRRAENSGSLESKKQYQLDLDRIVNGEDARTTLMIKNIPNKYTSKMLLAAIDENHRGTYDFLYLPIDFKNKCNVGYAFINMVSPSHIVPFYKAFNGKKWEKFNSEKVASLAYARIQGKTALVTHFQNSSLMNEDKRCRPILFHSEGQESVDTIFQEPFFSSNLNICIRQPDGSYSGDPLDSPKGSPNEKSESHLF